MRDFPGRPDTDARDRNGRSRAAESQGAGQLGNGALVDSCPRRGRLSFKVLNSRRLPGAGPSLGGGSPSDPGGAVSRSCNIASLRLLGGPEWPIAKTLIGEATHEKAGPDTSPQPRDPRPPRTRRSGQDRRRNFTGSHSVLHVRFVRQDLPVDLVTACPSRPLPSRRGGALLRFRCSGRLRAPTARRSVG